MLEGLLEVVGGAGLHCLDGALDLAEAGDDDDRDLGMAALEGAEDIDAVHVREAEVEQHQVGAHLVGGLEPLFARTDPVDFDLVPGQHPRTERTDVPFVVDDQDIVHNPKIAEAEQHSPNFLPPGTIAIRGSAERRYPYRRDSGSLQSASGFPDNCASRGNQWWQVTHSRGALLPRVAFCSRWHSTHQPIVSGRGGGRKPRRRTRSSLSFGPVSAPTTRIRSIGPWQVWHSSPNRTWGLCEK